MTGVGACVSANVCLRVPPLRCSGWRGQVGLGQSACDASKTIFTILIALFH